MYVYPAIKTTNLSKNSDPNHPRFEADDKKWYIDDVMQKSAKGKSSFLSHSVSNLSEEKKKEQSKLKEQNLIQELKRIDSQVRAHEMAHIAAAGSAATTGPRYTYMKGPDGALYAIGGEVSISLSSISGNPEATLAKARSIRAAALAPGDPSSADLSIAAAAGEMEQQALSALNSARLQNIENMQKSADLSFVNSSNKSAEVRSPGNRQAMSQYFFASMKLKEDSAPLIDMYA